MSSSRQVHLDSDSWRRLGEHDDDGVDPVPDDGSAGFGRRLSVIQRRTGSSLQQQQPEQQAIEASTKLISVTQQLRPKAEGSSTPAGIKAEASTIRLIRKRLPENRSPSIGNKNGTEESAVNATVVNETVQPIGEVTEQSIVPSETASRISQVRENATINSPEVSDTPLPIAELGSNSTTAEVSTTIAPASSSTTIASSNKPPWRVRMELNQSNRRAGQSTAKPADENISSPAEPATTTAGPSTVFKDLVSSIAEARNSTAVVSTSAPQVESSQSDNFSSTAVLPAAASSSSAPRPIQSTRIVSSTSGPLSAWTPIVRLPSTGSRNIPSGTLKIQITSTRLPPAVVSTPEPKLLEPEEENDVKNSQTIFTSGRSTTTTSTTTTTTEATTKKAAPPTPVMHSLEDILQRLVPAKDDSFGGNPFLVAPVAYQPVVASSEDANEIVSIGESRPSGSSRINDNLKGKNSSSTDANETQATTSIYVVGVVAVIPLAGVILWVVRVQLHKRREVQIVFFSSDHFQNKLLIECRVITATERIRDVLRNRFPQEVTTCGSDSVQTRPPLLRGKHIL